METTIKPLKFAVLRWREFAIAEKRPKLAKRDNQNVCCDLLYDDELLQYQQSNSFRLGIPCSIGYRLKWFITVTIFSIFTAPPNGGGTVTFLFIEAILVEFMGPLTWTTKPLIPKITFLGLHGLRVSLLSHQVQTILSIKVLITHSDQLSNYSGRRFFD